jgi:hypothetical protein
MLLNVGAGLAGLALFCFLLLGDMAKMAEIGRKYIAGLEKLVRTRLTVIDGSEWRLVDENVCRG